MTLTASAQLAQEPAFRDRVKVSMVRTAEIIAIEPWTAGKEEKGAKRHILAVAIVNNPDVYLDRFCWGVVANESLTSSSSDAAIAARVSSVFDGMADVLGSEL